MLGAGMASSMPRSLRLFQVVLWVSVAVVAGLYVVPSLLTTAQQQPGLSVTQEYLGPGIPMTAPFTLVTHEGTTVTEADFAGKPGAWFYGFTNCPDICPAALAEMSQLLVELGERADDINAVFVTVDPERDTQQVMGDYLKFFDPRLIGLTGTLDQITAMAKPRFVHFEKIPQGDTYAMQHPAGIFLTDAEGNFVGTLDPDEPMSTKLGKLRKLLETNGRAA